MLVPFSDPTIDGWIVQWNGISDVVEIVIGELDAPGARLPVSQAPASCTMWCVVESLLWKTICWPALTVTGFGENDWLPVIPTISIVTAELDGVPDGAVGDDEDDDPDPLQPAAKSNSADPTPTIRASPRS